MTGERRPCQGHGWKTRTSSPLLVVGYLLLFASTFTTSAMSILVTMSLGAACLAVSVFLWLLMT